MDGSTARSCSCSVCLMAVPHEVGPGQVQNDAGRRGRVMPHQRLDQEALQGTEGGDDLWGTTGGGGASRGEFEPVEGPHTAQGFAALAPATWSRTAAHDPFLEETNPPRPILPLNHTLDRRGSPASSSQRSDSRAKVAAADSARRE